MCGLRFKTDNNIPSEKKCYKIACDIAHNPIQHDHTKHVYVDRFFTREKLDERTVGLPKIYQKIN